MPWKIKNPKERSDPLRLAGEKSGPCLHRRWQTAFENSLEALEEIGFTITCECTQVAELDAALDARSRSIWLSWACRQAGLRLPRY